MSEPNIVKTPSDELRQAEADLARLEQEQAKAVQVVREKRINVMRVQAKSMGGSLHESHVNLTLANLELSDAEAGETRASQRTARARQNVDFCQRRHAAALRDARTINAQGA